jgi:hypothetical protein
MQDTSRLQMLVSMRAFSAFDPKEEYALESADLFVRLLLGE